MDAILFLNDSEDSSESQPPLRMTFVPFTDNSIEDLPFHTGNLLTEFERDTFVAVATEMLPFMHVSSDKGLSLMKRLIHQVFSKEYRKELARVGRLMLIRRILYSMVVRQVILNEARPYPSFEELQAMPFFEDNDFTPRTEEEVQSLLRFMRAVQTFHDMGFPGSNNKRTYIDVAAMLEGCGRSYAFGGAPSKATICRMMIFHVVTGIPFETDLISRFKQRRVSSATVIKPSIDYIQFSK